MINRRDLLVGLGALAGAALVVSRAQAQTIVGGRDLRYRHDTDGLYPHQRKWVEDNSQIAIWNKARQIGGTTAATHQAAKWAQRGEQTIIVSQCELDSASVRDRAENQLAVMGLRITSKTPQGLRLANGTWILTLPSTFPLKWLVGNVILDEFAFYQDQERVFDDALNTVSALRSKLRIISSPNGSNLFRKLWERERAWSRHMTPLAAVADSRFPISNKDAWQIARNDVRTFDRLFSCSFG